MSRLPLLALMLLAAPYEGLSEPLPMRRKDSFDDDDATSRKPTTQQVTQLSDESIERLAKADLKRQRRANRG